MAKKNSADPNEPFTPYQPTDPSLPIPAPTPGVPPTATRVDQKQKNSKLGLIALILAIIGFVFACVPGALIVGWVLLPVAFILGIVALFQKGKKAFAITSIILAVIGTIVGVVVFMGAVGKAVDDATSTTVTSPEIEQSSTKSGEEKTSEAADTEKAQPDSAQGTRDNPAPIGSTISSSDWDVVINSVNLDGNQAVADANQFNAPPAEGMKYIVVNATLTYKGADSSNDLMVTYAFVSEDGTVYKTFDAPVSAPEPALGLNELYTDGSVTGNVVIQVPVDAKGLLRVTPGILAQDTFVKVQ